MTFFDKLIDFSLTWWYIISITIISGVNFRPKKCWAKVEQKSCEPKTRKNVIFRYTGSRKMSISDVIVVIEKKWDMFWRVDVMRSTQKKIIKIRPQIKNRQGGGKITPPFGNHWIWKTLIYHGLSLPRVRRRMFASSRSMAITSHQCLLSSLDAIIDVRCQFLSIHPGHLPTSVAT